MNRKDVEDYLREQDHVFLTGDEITVLAKEITALAPFETESQEVAHLTAPPTAEEMFPLNAKYIKPILTRIGREEARHRQQVVAWIQDNPGVPTANGPYWLHRPARSYNGATENKHKRARELQKMYEHFNLMIRRGSWR